MTLDDVYAACTMTTEHEFVDVLANVLVLKNPLHQQSFPSRYHLKKQIVYYKYSHARAHVHPKTVFLSRFQLRRGYWLSDCGVVKIGKETNWMLENLTIKNFKIHLNGLMIKTVMTKERKASTVKK